MFVALVTGLGTSLWQTAIATRANKDALAAEAEKEIQRIEADEARASESEIRLKSQEQERIARRMSYASDMNLAQRVLEQNNVGRAKTLLERHRPSAGEIDLRGWEWNYLWSLTQSDAIETVWSQSEPITSLNVSHDARWMAFSHHAPARNPRPYRDSEVVVSIMNLETKQVVNQWDSELDVLAFSPTQPEFVFYQTRDIQENK